MAIRGTVVIDRDRCKGCELCVVFCPQKVLIMENDYNIHGYRPVRLEENGHRCTGCSVCALVCPDVAFIVYRQPHLSLMQTA